VAKKDAPKSAGKASSKAGAKSDAKADDAAGSGDAARSGDASGAPAGDRPKKKKKAQQVAIGPDSFIDRVQPHIAKIAVGMIALFVVLGGWVGWRWWKHRGETKDTVQLAQALDIAQRDVVAPGDQPTPPTSTDVTYPSDKERAEAALGALARVKKVGGPLTDLDRAALLMDAGKLDDAGKAYQAISGQPGLDGVLAREGLGYVAEARAALTKDAAEQQKLLEQALAAFKSMQPDDDGPRRDYALYDQARILDQMNRHAEARDLLNQALELAPQSEIAPDIKARLALLEAP
jgi:tetratricopeptide (TPR) repeat protein